MNIPSKLGYLLYLLDSEFKGSTTRIVGGCVRDFLLGKQPKDFDVATDIHIDGVHEVLSRGGFQIDTTGKQFLVLNASKDGEMYEISNFRKDGVSYDGRRPSSVEIGTLEEDAYRRDFTINALYYDNKTKSITAPIPTSLVDIGNRLLRFIGKPEDRIKEDYLRVFRFYRFISQKELSPEKKSLKACRTYFNEALDNTDGERIRNEIERMIE